MDFSTPPNGISAWLACLCFVLGIVWLARQIILSYREPAPTPPNAQLDETHKQLERRVKALEEQRQTDIAEAKRDRGDLYEHIDTVRRELQSDIKDRHETTLKSIHAMPQQIIAILRDTNAIGPRQSL